MFFIKILLGVKPYEYSFIDTLKHSLIKRNTNYINQSNRHYNTPNMIKKQENRQTIDDE